MEEDTKEFVVPNNDNEIIEIGTDDYKEDLTSFSQEPDMSNDEIEDLIVERKEYDEESKTLKKPKKSLKSKWNNLSKKGKIIVISVIVLLIAIIAVVAILLLKKDDSGNTKKEEVVILEKDNYRYENGVLVLLDENDEEIGKYECENKNEKICHVAYSLNDNFDQEKYVYEDGSEVRQITPIIDNKLVFIHDDKEDNDNVILYNISDKEVIDTYNAVKVYEVNNEYYVSLASDKDLYGLYKYDGNELVSVIDSKYDYLGIYSKEGNSNTYAVGLANNRYTLISLTGEDVSKKIAYEIKSYNDSYIVTCDDDNNYSVVDYNNNKIFNNSYQYIGLYSDVAVVIKDGLLSVIDFNENKLINKDVTLSNTYYNKTYVYDENGKYLETNESFWVTINENNVTVEYYDTNNNIKSNVINVYESLTASKYDYVSYYDGVLYFYSDEGKTNLIGSYKCSNKNNIDSADDVYDRCYVAKESNYSTNEINNGKTSLGYLPIINNRFVFISDTIDDSVSSVALYDLEKSKTLGSYQSVDAGIYQMSDSVTFVNGDVVFIGLSTKKQKYGVIKVDDSEASSVLSVTYDSIERIGEYFEAELSGTYQLFDESGTSVSEKIGYKITNYSTNYLKCLDGTKYAVADYKGNTLDKGLSFVDVESSYYVTINSDKEIVINEYGNEEEIKTGIILESSNDYIGTVKTGEIYSIKYTTSTGTFTEDVNSEV